MSAVLEIRSLNKSFGGIKATDDLSLSVEQGELHAIIGPNGAGKTTLISQLSGMQTPDTGAPASGRGAPVRTSFQGRGSQSAWPVRSVASAMARVRSPS